MSQPFPPPDIVAALKLDPVGRLLYAFQDYCGPDPFQLVEILNEYDVRYLIAGESAAVMHGLPIPLEAMTIYLASDAHNYLRVETAFVAMRSELLDEMPPDTELPVHALLSLPGSFEFPALLAEAVVMKLNPEDEFDEGVQVVSLSHLRQLVTAELQELRNETTTHEVGLSDNEIGSVRQELNALSSGLRVLARTTELQAGRSL